LRRDESERGVLRMTKTTRQKQIEAKKEKLAKLQAQIRSEESKERKAARKQRDTALFTLGGTFAALLEESSTRDEALRLWERYLAHQAPALMTDRRRAALKNVFSLEPKTTPPPHAE
jgi:hypothetical protein